MTTLRVKMIEEMTLQRFSPKTKKAYLGAVGGLAKFYNRPPDKINQEQVRAYFLHLLDERKLAWASCNVVACGLRFFYTHVLERKDITLSIPASKTKSKLPDILNEKELESLFMHAGNFKERVLLMTTYSGGLRVSEVVRLQVKDINSERMAIRVRQGKGNKDRDTLLSKKLLVDLRVYWQRYRPRVWLFPGWDKNSPLSISAAQKAYDRAKDAAGIKKGPGIHTLRHCFATHLLDRGVDPRTIQVLMGHRSIGTTMRYCQVTPKRIASIESPLDRIEFQSMELPPPGEEKHDDNHF